MYRYLLSISLLMALIAGACSGDDPNGAEPEVSITVVDFAATIPNQSPSGYLIGQIEASANAPGNLTFELVSESVAGALSIGATNGSILIEDASVFDHDENATINATVEVRHAEAVSAAAITITIDELTAFELQAMDYFKDIALGFEFGNVTEITRKWREPMRVNIGGAPTTELLEEMDLIIGELRELISDDFEIELVDTRAESNYFVFFGSGDQYGSLFPGSADFTASNWGLFSVFWGSDQYINSGHMYVDIFRANGVEQRHLLREEFTQSLGLAKDSEQYGNSIFQAAWTRTTSYTDLDREIIRLLYHPQMTSGLNATQAETVIRRIYTND